MRPGRPRRAARSLGVVQFALHPVDGALVGVALLLDAVALDGELDDASGQPQHFGAQLVVGHSAPPLSSRDTLWSNAGPCGCSGRAKWTASWAQVLASRTIPVLVAGLIHTRGVGPGSMAP